MFDKTKENIEKQFDKKLSDDDLRRIAKDIPIEEIEIKETNEIKKEKPQIIYRDVIKEVEKKDPPFIVKEEKKIENKYLLLIIGSVVGFIILVCIGIHLYQDYNYNKIYENKDLSQNINVETPVNVFNNISETPVTVTNQHDIFNNVTIQIENKIYCNGNNS